MSSALVPTPMLARTACGTVVAGGEVIHQRVRAERAVAHADAVLGAERRRQQRGIEAGDVEADHADAVVAALPQLVGAHAVDRVEAREQPLEQRLLVGLDALPARRRSSARTAAAIANAPSAAGVPPSWRAGPVAHSTPSAVTLRTAPPPARCGRPASSQSARPARTPAPYGA